MTPAPRCGAPRGTAETGGGGNARTVEGRQERQLHIWGPSEKHPGDSFPLADGGDDDHRDAVSRMRGFGYFTGNGAGGLGLSFEEAHARQMANSAHIAANSPSTTLALLAYIAELEAGLRPFAEAADSLDEHRRDTSEIWEDPAAMAITAGDLRRAAALLPKASVREERG